MTDFWEVLDKEREPLTKDRPSDKSWVIDEIFEELTSIFSSDRFEDHLDRKKVFIAMPFESISLSAEVTSGQKSRKKKVFFGNAGIYEQIISGEQQLVTTSIEAPLISHHLVQEEHDDDMAELLRIAGELKTENAQLRLSLQESRPPKQLLRISAGSLILGSGSFFISSFLNIHLLHPLLAVSVFGMGLLFYFMSKDLAKAEK